MGAPIVVSGAVIRPKFSVRLQHRDGADKIVAWAHGTAGLADICAPSEQSNFDVVQAGVDGIYAHLIASYVARGWTVAASDFPGLGTDGPSPYLVGDSEGRAIIDAVRAARHLDPFLSRDWVVVGHSQGGQAALFASELAPSYGRGLDLRGTVAMAPASSLEALLPAMVGTPLNALVVWTVYGLAALDPSVVPEDILAPPALAQIDALTNGCANEGLVAFGALSASDFLVGGALPADFGAKLAANDPGQRPNGSPTLLVQGEQDPIIPPPITESLLVEECGINSRSAAARSLPRRRPRGRRAGRLRGRHRVHRRSLRRSACALVVPMTARSPRRPRMSSAETATRSGWRSTPSSRATPGWRI